MNKTGLLIIILFFVFSKGICGSLPFKTKGGNPSDSIKITMPNIFTPNSDGKNDTWSMIITNGLEIFELHTIIYNRYGKQVFESTNVRQNWNGFNQYEGTLCSDGTYFYVVSYLDGNTNETKTLNGFIEIIK